MKRFISILIAALLIAALSLPALASDYGGDVVIKKAKVYSSKSLKGYLFTIPANTAVQVDTNPEWCGIGKDFRDYKVSRVNYNGWVGYIKTSKLLKDEYKYYGTYKLKKGTRIYQRPTTSAKSKKLKKKTQFFLCGVKGNWALVRTNALDFCGKYGYVKL